MKKLITALATAAFFAACSPNGSDNAVSTDSIVTHDTGTNLEGTGGGSTGNSEANLQADSVMKMSDSATSNMNGGNARQDSSKNETSNP
jgi:hypothetical protein